MLSELRSTSARLISFPIYSEETIEQRRYNLMQHFGVFPTDDWSISQLLFHSTKLVEDLIKAEERRKQQETQQRSSGSRAPRVIKMPAGSVKRRR